jgi:hypothetical protein
MSTKSPLGSLPVDPTNTTSSGLFYTYQMSGTKYELTTNLESQKYQTIEANDGGLYSDLFEKGASLALAPQDFANVSFGSGNVSQSNMRLSIASNTAFVDFNSAGTLTPYIGDKITITDSTGHQLVGWIKASGSGETYSSELALNTDFANTTNVTMSGSVADASVGSGQSGNALQITETSDWSGHISETITTSNGGAYLWSAYVKNGTASLAHITMQQAVSPYNVLGKEYYVSSASDWTHQYSSYATADNTSELMLFEGKTGTSLMDTLSVKQVLTPSATGVTIVSTSGGSVYNWTSQDINFNLNDTGGYTYSITKS